MPIMALARQGQCFRPAPSILVIKRMFLTVGVCQVSAEPGCTAAVHRCVGNLVALLSLAMSHLGMGPGSERGEGESRGDYVECDAGSARLAAGGGESIFPSPTSQ